ncbi:MAG: hypothetical protein HY770_00030 [Chitinivibrionia bacterium]|nr:hypothetical protein [Chitinivibrionia bacterium]
MKRLTTRSYWLGFILIAVALHLVLLLTVKRSFFSIFLKSTPSGEQPDRGAPFSPDAIITVPVTFDDESSERTIERPVIAEDSERPPAASDSASLGLSPHHRFAFDGPAGSAETPLRSPSEDRAEPIPPKPVEIAWPDIRGLKKCLGESIEFHILVADSGRILRIEAVDANAPPECVTAATVAARKIVFLPGLIDGRPAEMWTRIRIDFRDRR